MRSTRRGPLGRHGARRYRRTMDGGYGQSRVFVYQRCNRPVCAYPRLAGAAGSGRTGGHVLAHVRPGWQDKRYSQHAPQPPGGTAGASQTFAPGSLLRLGTDGRSAGKRRTILGARDQKWLPWPHIWLAGGRNRTASVREVTGHVLPGRSGWATGVGFLDRPARAKGITGRADDPGGSRSCEPVLQSDGRSHLPPSAHVSQHRRLHGSS
jgi:hypothetical protein